MPVDGYVTDGIVESCVADGSLKDFRVRFDILRAIVTNRLAIKPQAHWLNYEKRDNFPWPLHARREIDTGKHLPRSQMTASAMRAIKGVTWRRAGLTTTIDACLQENRVVTSGLELGLLTGSQ